jgi:hypothetical protein
MKSNRRALLPGQLAPVPRFQELPYLIGPGPTRDCYVSVHQTMVDLGRAVQMGQHRLLVDSLASMSRYAFRHYCGCFAQLGSLLGIQRLLYNTGANIPLAKRQTRHIDSRVTP